MPPVDPRLKGITYLHVQEALGISDVSDDEFELDPKPRRRPNGSALTPEAVQRRQRWGVKHPHLVPRYIQAIRHKIDEEYLLYLMDFMVGLGVFNKKYLDIKRKEAKT